MLSLASSASLPETLALGLQPGQVFSLSVSRAGGLVVKQGRAWVTLDAAPQGFGPLAGDHHLNPGQALSVAAGRHVVVEAEGAQALRIEWHSGLGALERSDASVAPRVAPWRALIGRMC